MGDILEVYVLWAEAIEKSGLDGELEKPAAESVEGLYSIQVLDIFHVFCFVGSESEAYQLTISRLRVS